MEFTRIRDKLDNVSALPDTPKAIDGYTPSVIKAEFDKAALTLQRYINEILLCQLEGSVEGTSGAELIGSAKIDGLSGSTVHRQLCSLRDNLALAANAAIPDGVLSREKLSPALLGELDRLSTLSFRSKCYSTAGEYRFIAPADGLYRFMAVGAGSAGTHYADLPDSFGFIEARGGASGGFCRFDMWLSKGDPVDLVVGDGSSSVDGFRLDQVMSRQQYLEHFALNETYASGGYTQISFGNSRAVICYGGDCRRERSGVEFTGVEKGISLSGHRHEWEGDRILSCGADSAVGNGGTRDLEPGAGGGGAGGSLYIDSDGSVIIKRLASKGADGMITIEYMGGNDDQG